MHSIDCRNTACLFSENYHDNKCKIDRKPKNHTYVDLRSGLDCMLDKFSEYYCSKVVLKKSVIEVQNIIADELMSIANKCIIEYHHSLDMLMRLRDLKHHKSNVRSTKEKEMNL